jgi:hypothetical protein
MDRGQKVAARIYYGRPRMALNGAGRIRKPLLYPPELRGHPNLDALPLRRRTQSYRNERRTGQGGPTANRAASGSRTPRPCDTGPGSA